MVNHDRAGAPLNQLVHKPTAVKKLTLGVASVALGTTFILANSAVAQAADTTPNQGSNDNSTVVTNGSANQGAVVNLSASQSDDDSDHTGEPSVPEENLDPAIVPISTVIGQEPAANLAITPTRESGIEYQSSWKQAPDVSKAGATTGIVNVQYTDYEGQAINKDFSVPVNVFAKESDYATVYGDPASIPASDRVQTVIRFYDLATGKVVETDIIYMKRDDADQQNATSDTIQYLEENYARYAEPGLPGRLGYEMVNSGRLNSLDYTSNNVVTVLVKPSQDTQKPYITDPNDNQYLRYDIENGNNLDPAIFIGNIGTLPAGTTVKWLVAPKWDLTKDSRGMYENPYPTNQDDIAIEVDIPGKAPVILKGQELSDACRISSFDDNTPILKSSLTTYVGEIPDAQSAVAKYTPDDPDTPATFKWTVKPNVTRPGYSYAWLGFNGSQWFPVLVQVLAKPAPKPDPVQPTDPTTPTDPTDPTRPTTPTQPSQPAVPAQPGQPGQQATAGRPVSQSQGQPRLANQSVQVSHRQSAPVQQLPQTGNDHVAGALAGLGLVSLLGMFGLKKRQFN
ncbi:Rib/alpha-like domain-containing protein [Limosilactobacillus antri]|uniref:Rib/alpha-like domain-containing protein n=1 Tax=Limosilactobacillus antri TaxID=227943 RepID=UPI001F565D37|nr:Rib/alpha-like domain-containing protein [Limosilactobacillus antri]